MNHFEDGYNFALKNGDGIYGSLEGSRYIDIINNEIDEMINNFKKFEGFRTSTDVLKGDLAEYWHSGTHNIDAALKGSNARTFVDRSHDFASPDITSNFGEKYGLKYYSSGIKSAKSQSVSLFQKFSDYKSCGGRDTLEEFLSKRGYDNCDKILADPIYSGQIRIIPKEQMEDAIYWLKKKISEEGSKRPEQVARYQETLNLLRDRIRSSDGAESIPLSVEEAEKLACLAKQGKINPEDLNLTTEELIKYEYILQNAFKAGITAATISIVLKIAPEIYKTISYLISEGEIDYDQFKKVGFAAISGGAEGFIRGSVSATITASLKAGLLGKTFKSINPSLIGATTVIVMNTMKNSFSVVKGDMSNGELTNELVKEMFITSWSLMSGGVTQSFIQIPVLGFMLGSFLGTIVGSFVYSSGYSAFISFCVDTGFTMFGLVDQNYELPKEIIKELGIEIFEYEQFEYEKFQYEEFIFERFEYDNFMYDQIDIKVMRRGVIGVNRIGYV